MNKWYGSSYTGVISDRVNMNISEKKIKSNNECQGQGQRQRMVNTSNEWTKDCLNRVLVFKWRIGYSMGHRSRLGAAGRGVCHGAIFKVNRVNGRFYPGVIALDVVETADSMGWGSRLGPGLHLDGSHHFKPVQARFYILVMQLCLGCFLRVGVGVGVLGWTRRAPENKGAPPFGRACVLTGRLKELREER